MRAVAVISLTAGLFVAASVATAHPAPNLYECPARVTQPDTGTISAARILATQEYEAPSSQAIRRAMERHSLDLWRSQLANQLSDPAMRQLTFTWMDAAPDRLAAITEQHKLAQIEAMAMHYAHFLTQEELQKLQAFAQTPAGRDHMFGGGAISVPNRPMSREEIDRWGQGTLTFNAFMATPAGRHYLNCQPLPQQDPDFLAATQAYQASIQPQIQNLQNELGALLRDYAANHPEAKLPVGN